MIEIKVFLASSIFEFKEERYDLDRFFSILNKIYSKNDIGFELVTCEKVSKKYVPEGKQSLYNSLIPTCQYFYVLIGEEAGPKTVEEFDEAVLAYKKGGLPKIYTYVHNLDSRKKFSESVTKFLKHVDEDLGHYYDDFPHIDTIKAEFLLELSRDYLNGSETFAFKDGMAVMGNEKIFSLENIPVYHNNNELNILISQKNELEKQIGTLIDIRTVNPENDSVLYELLDISEKRAAVLKEIRDKEEKILDLYKTVILGQNEGSASSWYEIEAKKYINLGDYDAASGLLKDVQRKKNLDIAMDVADAGLTAIKTHIRENYLLIKTLEAQSRTKEIIDEVISIYEETYKLILRYSLAVEFGELIYNYSSLMNKQKHYNESLEIAKYLVEIIDLSGTSDISLAINVEILIAEVFHIQKKYDDEMECYNKVEKLIGNDHDIFIYEQFELCFNKGKLFIIKKNYDDAKKSIQNAINLLEYAVTDDERIKLSSSYGSMGRVSNAENSIREAAEYYSAAEQSILDIENYSDNEDAMTSLSTIYNNSGYMYLTKTEDMEKARIYFEKSLDIRNDWRKKNPERWTAPYSLALTNMGLYYNEVSDYETALTLLNEAYKIRSVLFNRNEKTYALGLAVTCGRLAYSLYKTGETEKALINIKKAAGLVEPLYESDHRSNSEEIMNIYRLYAEIMQKDNQSDSQKYYDKVFEIENESDWYKNESDSIGYAILSRNHLSYARFIVETSGFTKDAENEYSTALNYLNVLAETSTKFKNKVAEVELEIAELSS